MPRRVLGLDLGSHSVKAVELQTGMRAVAAGAMHQLASPSGGPAEVASALRDFVSTNDLPTEYVVTSLAGSARRLSFPFRDRRRVGAAVPFELDTLVPFDLDEFVLDWQVVAEEAGRTEVVAALAARDDLRALLEELSAAGIDPRVVEPEGLVLANLAEIFSLPGTRLLIDVGHEKTTLCLCREGRGLATRSLPIAGRAFSQALARERGVELAEAERIKCGDGIFGGGGRPASREATAVAERLAQEILRTLGSLEPLMGDLALDRIELLGGSARLHRLDEFVAERTGIATGRLELPGGELGTALAGAGDPLLFAPALALAARGSLRPHSRMNLRQGEFAPRVTFGRLGRDLGGTAALLGLAGLLALGGFAVNGAVNGRRADLLEAQAQAIYAQAFPGEPPARNVRTAMEQAVQDARRRADTLGLYHGNLSALDLLSEMSAQIPKDLDVVFEELTIDPKMVQVKGHTPTFGSVDDLRRVLDQVESAFEINVGDITTDTRRGGQNFSVRIRLEPEEES